MKKRVLSLVLALVLVAVGLPLSASAATSGKCGENLTWVLDDEGTLTISGSGRMYNFSYPNYGPWYKSTASIKKVIVEDGVTSIGQLAFYRCIGLTNVTIGNNTTTIGSYAFQYCSSLTSITIPGNLTAIGSYAFSYCSKLRVVYFNGSEARWKKISIGNYNTYLLSATIYFSVKIIDSQPSTSINTSNYYGPLPQRSFFIYPQGIDSSSFSGGFKVTVDGQDYYGAKDMWGYSMLGGSEYIGAPVSENYTGNVDFSRAGFFDLSIPSSIVGQITSVGMVPDTVTAPYCPVLMVEDHPVIQLSNNGDFTNALFGAYSEFEKDLTGKEESTSTRIYPIVCWNGHGEGTIWMEQGGKKVALNNNAFNAVTLADQFVVGKPIYLCAVAGDGKQLKQLTKIRIEERTTTIDIDLGEVFSLDLADAVEEDLDLLVGQSIGVDFSELTKGVVPIKFDIDEDGSVQGVIGLQYAEKDKRAAFGTMKEALCKVRNDQMAESTEKLAQLLSDLKKKNIYPAKTYGTLGISGSVSVIGYFTGNVTDGRLGLNEIKTALVFEAGESYTWNTIVMPLEIPAYVKVGLKAKLEVYQKYIYDAAQNKMTLSGEVPLELGVSLSGEAGPGWEGFLSCGVKGTGKLKMKAQKPFYLPSINVSLSAGLSVVGSLAGISGEWKLYETPEMIFWDGSVPGHWCWKNADSATPNNFTPNLSRRMMRLAYAPEDAIVVGVSGYTAPALAELSDGRLLAVWTADVSSRKAVDKNGLYYSIRKGGVWSAPALVNDDGTNDSVPQLHQENGTTYLAWQNYTTVFNTDSQPDYDVLSEQMSTVVSVFDESSGTWQTPTAQSHAWYLAAPELPADLEEEPEGSFKQVLDDGTMRAVLFTALDENEVEQVWGVFHDGYNWGQPIQLTEDAAGVDAYSAAFTEDGLSILYASGAYDNASLTLANVELAADLAVTGVDYIRETLVPESDLTLSAKVKNQSSVTVNGVTVEISRSGETIHSEDIAVRFDSGEEDTLYVNYTLPDTIDFSELSVKVTPMLDTDADESDNSAICALQLCDLSVENVSAVSTGGATEVVTQIVNRGQIETATSTLTYHKNSPDGEVLGTDNLTALAAGEVLTLSKMLSDLHAGDMVYVEASALEGENLIGNNSSQAVVTESAPAGLHLSVAGEKTGNRLALSVSVENSGITNLTGAIVAVAAYDASTNRMLDCKLCSGLDVDALNAWSEEMLLSVGNRENLRWKVFALNDDAVPLCSESIGSVA